MLILPLFKLAAFKFKSASFCIQIETVKCILYVYVYPVNNKFVEFV